MCDGGGSRGGICILWNSRNLTTRTYQCQLFVSWSRALLGELKPCPSPPQVFSFLEGMERGAGPRPCFVCDWWGGGSSKNFRLLSDADPVRQAHWGCTLITYLIREEFKLCVLERGGVEGAKELPLETTSLNLG